MYLRVQRYLVSQLPSVRIIVQLIKRWLDLSQPNAFHHVPVVRVEFFNGQERVLRLEVVARTTSVEDHFNSFTDLVARLGVGEYSSEWASIEFNRGL